ncbi:hypothetical protein WMY93_008020 [Mugilogobius chulae]|uniref:Transposase Helix-turn-helix domain-containing protein n=1 Tax=Mugilogobius chulae TaxID=88201 RepID=A0AAW0PNK2_9GOBI
METRPRRNIRCCLATAVMLHQMIKNQIARRVRRRRQLKRVLTLLIHWKEERGLYLKINTSCPLIAVYANPEACMKKDFRVSRETFRHLMQRIPNMKDHGWKPDMELLVFLYYLGHGLSLAVVSATFGMPKSTVHDIVHRVSAKITSKLPEVISFPSAEELPNICQGFATLAQNPAFD